MAPGASSHSAVTRRNVRSLQGAGTWGGVEVWWSWPAPLWTELPLQRALLQPGGTSLAPGQGRVAAEQSAVSCSENASLGAV